MKIKKVAAIFILGILLVPGFACNGGPAATPTPTPTPTVVLFSDDFSDESSGWDTFSDVAGSAAYQDGWLHIRDSTTPEGTTVSRAHRYFTNFIVEVEMKLVAGTDDNWQSIMFRYVDEENYYSGEISADGYYEMQLWHQGSLHELVYPTQSAYIHQGLGVTNLLRIECVGSTFRLSVNGHLLAEVTDATFDGGDICLEVNSLAGTFSEVAFDNIVVTAP